MKRRTHRVSLTNALIWAAVILAVAVLLRGTEHAGMVGVVLSGAAGASITFVSKALRKNHS